MQASSLDKSETASQSSKSVTFQSSSEDQPEVKENSVKGKRKGHAFEKLITKSCQILAVFVEKNKFCFVVIPFLIAVIFAHGLGRLTYATDNEYLFVPSTAQSLVTRKEVEAIFPTNFSAYVPGHESRYLHQLEVIIVSKTSNSVLTTDLWEEIERFNNFMVKKLTVSTNKIKIRFEDVCAKFNTECLQNGFLALTNVIKDVEKSELNLTYPVMKNPIDFNNYLLPPHLGGLKLDPGDEGGRVIRHATAMRLTYILDCSKGVIELADAWEDGALEAIQNYRTNFSKIEAVNSKSISRELVFNIHDAIPYIPVAIGLVIAYTVANLYHPEDSSKIKIWVGILGLVNTIMATVFAWGVLGYIGCPWQAINLASVFLLLGVGLDDTFVMLAAWNHTDPKLPLEKRMEKTYKEAAVSITITSLTNILSFVVGGLCPGYSCVKIFCFYTGAGIFSVYIYNLTFFGAFLAIFGDLEEKGCHGLFCVRKDPLKKLKDPDEKIASLKGPITLSQHFFDRWLPDFLLKSQIRILVLVIFGIFLGFNIYWCAHTREGFEKWKLARSNSRVVKYYDLEDEHFRLNPYRLQIIINEPVDYSDETVRKSIEDLLNNFKKSEFIAQEPGFDENWLAEFMKAMQKKSELMQKELKILLSKQNFMSELNEFLRLASKTPIVHNFKLSVDKSEILASRFFLQTSNVSDSNGEMNMLRALRRIAANCTIKVIVFNPFFPFIDMFMEVRTSVFLCLSVGTVIMFVVALGLIPNFGTAFWVFFTIMSIEVGVFGLMYLWDINLDVISMICLIMCIGFSVDFSAHISYHFMASDCDSSDERLRSSLSSFGTPIIQGGVSTILAIVVFAHLQSYILQSFAKMLFLVISLGLLHGLFILPVFLSVYNEFIDIIFAKKRSLEEVSPYEEEKD